MQGKTVRIRSELGGSKKTQVSREQILPTSLFYGSGRCQGAPKDWSWWTEIKNSDTSSGETELISMPMP